MLDLQNRKLRAIVTLIFNSLNENFANGNFMLNNLLLQFIICLTLPKWHTPINNRIHLDILAVS